MKKVYELLKQVPKGKVTTYGELAKAAKTSPRAVGVLMHVNPYVPAVPCHRVIMSNGSLGGFAGGVKKKIAMLKSEGIKIKNNKIDLKKYLHRF